MTLDKEENLTLAEKRAKLEKEKLTRRQALARFGFQAGAAAVAALTADDLLRKVGEELQRRSGDSKVVQQVAKEFQQAGVALGTPICAPDETWDSELELCIGTTCDKCESNKRIQTDGPNAPNGTGVCWLVYPDAAHIQEREACLKKAMVAWCKCMKLNQCPGAPTIPQCIDCTSLGC